MTAPTTFESDLTDLLNRYSRENESNTPDFILATYLVACLDAYDAAVKRRAEWFGRIDSIGEGSIPYGPNGDHPDAVDSSDPLIS